MHQWQLLTIVLQNQNREEIKKINLELSRVDASAGRMQDVERDIRNTVRKLLFYHYFVHYNIFDVEY